MDRREFLKLAAAGAAVAAAPAVFNKVTGSGPKEEGAHRWVMIIDQDKCNGCESCMFACRAHNDVPPEMAWNKVLEHNEKEGLCSYMPVQCMHCEEAPCVNVCPVKATYHRPDGIVMMDYDRCIGCRYCEIACPYGARSFNWQEFTGDNPAVPEWGEPEIERRPRGVVEKCSFCFHRIDRGLAAGLVPGVDSQATPACVAACPQGARIFGDANDPDSEVSKILNREHSTQIRADLGTKPRIYYLHVDRRNEEVA